MLIGSVIEKRDPSSMSEVGCVGTFINFTLLYIIMSVYSNPWEMDAIREIIREVKEKHSLLHKDHLVQLVAAEAQSYGIKPDISAPIVRMLIEKNGILVP
jgi:flagellar biosynthesis protein FliR